MPRIGSFAFLFLLLLAGCRHPEEAKFTQWADTPSPQALTGEFATLVRIGEGVENAAKSRAFYKGKPIAPITTRTTFFGIQKQEANIVIGSNKVALLGLLGNRIRFVYTPLGLDSPPIYLRGIRLIGESLIWDLESAIESQNYDAAIFRVGQLTRLGGMLCGGGGYEATLGISLIDRARILIAPQLVNMGAGQLGQLGKQISIAIKLRPQLETSIENESKSMLLALQEAQDMAASKKYDQLVKILGKVAEDEVAQLRAQSNSPEKTVDVFDWIGNDIKLRSKWHVDKFQNPSMQVSPPELKERKNWRLLYRYFATNLDSLSPYLKTSSARTQLLMLECYLRQKVKIKLPLPTDLKVFSPTAVMDPFTGKPFFYKQGGGEFRVYSSGADGIDDGGETNESFDSPDLVLERKRQS